MARTYSSRQPMYSTGSRTRRSTGSRRVRPVGATPRRRRGPAPIIIIVAILAIVVFLWVFGRGCSGSQQAQENDRLKTYASATAGAIQGSAAIAQQFNGVANGVAGLPKAEVDKQLTEMQNACKSTVAEFEKIKAPSKATNLQPAAVLALNMRAKGVAEYQAGIMAVLNNTDPAAAAQSIAKGLKDLVVSDEVLLNYRDELQAKLTAGKEDVQVADPGRFVLSIDSASTASIAAYITSIAKSTGALLPAASPQQAMINYLKKKGVDYSSMSFSVVQTSKSDAGWKIDQATESGAQPTFILLHGVNGGWMVVDSGTSLTAAKLKADGAPADLPAP